MSLFINATILFLSSLQLRTTTAIILLPFILI